MTSTAGAAPPAVRFYAQSHVGRVRTANEDSYIVAELGDQGAPSAGALLVVADGMGGSVGGAQASRAVVQTLRDQLTVGIHAQAGAQLAEAVRIANRTVHAIPMQHPELRGMGSTCTAMVLLREHVHIAHVGDSRAYLVRDGRILQLTHDHTKMHLLLQSGMITPEEAAVHPERSVLVRSIGPKPEVEVDQLPPLTVQKGDRILLCSDGLINHVADPEILALVEDRSEEDVVESLIQLALERGGTDNTTVLMMVVGPRRRRSSAPAGPPPTIHEPIRGARAVLRARVEPEPPSRGRPVLLLGGVVALVCLLGMVGAGALWLGSDAEETPSTEPASTKPAKEAPPAARLATDADKTVFSDSAKDERTARLDSSARRVAKARQRVGTAKPSKPPLPVGPGEDADGDGFTVESGDCDDANPNIFPGTLELWYDGIDQDCDGKDDYDADQDGHRSAEQAAGDDCDDRNPDVHPGAVERWYDDIDQDCDDRNDHDADGDGLTRDEECNDTDPGSTQKKVEPENCDGKERLTCRRWRPSEGCTFRLKDIGSCDGEPHPRTTDSVEWMYGRARVVGNPWAPISFKDVQLEDVYILCDCEKRTCDLQPKYHN